MNKIATILLTAAVSAQNAAFRTTDWNKTPLATDPLIWNSLYTRA